MYTEIKRIHAREIMDSRGIPTVEVEVVLGGGAFGRTAVPLIAANGAHEAHEMPDGDKNGYQSKQVRMTVEHVNGEIAAALHGMDALDQGAVDRAMLKLDGTPHKGRLGASAILSASLAVAQAAANSSNLPLFHYLGGAVARRMPVPMFNILNGGAYANWQGIDLQKIMIAPAGAPNYSEALRWGGEVYLALKKILSCGGYSTSASEEGGFAPLLKRNVDALDLIVRAIEKAGYRPGEDIVIAIDMAASDFYENGRYCLNTEDKRLDADEMVAMYAEWVRQYPLAVLEDGLAEEDWDGWKRLGSALGKKVELVGDDLFATNVGRIKRGIKENVANAVLINLNQIGSISEVIEVVQLAYEGGWGVMVSHCGSEMVDSFIADFTVAFGTGHIKAGAPVRGKLVEKYNQLLSIDEYLGESAVYAGHKAFMHSK